jgi:hypothetical protein
MSPFPAAGSLLTVCGLKLLVAWMTTTEPGLLPLPGVKSHVPRHPLVVPAKTELGALRLSRAAIHSSDHPTAVPMWIDNALVADPINLGVAPERFPSDRGIKLAPKPDEPPLASSQNLRLVIAEFAAAKYRRHRPGWCKNTVAEFSTCRPHTEQASPYLATVPHHVLIALAASDDSRLVVAPQDNVSRWAR